MATQRYFHLHLVSDATGETLIAVGRAAAAQYKHTHAIEHIHSLVRTQALVERALREIEQSPGIVLYTLVDPALAAMLENGCRKLGVPCVSVLDPVLTAFQSYLGTRSAGRVGAQHVLDAEYFRRIDALNFSLAHDDGQHVEAIDEADVVLVGVSRTSKTPTSIYLANRGIKTANFPLVPGAPLPPRCSSARKPLVVGLVASPDRIVQVRQHRVLAMKSDELTDSYVDRDLRDGGDRLEPKALRPAGLAGHRRDAPLDRGDGGGGHGAARGAEAGMTLDPRLRRAARAARCSKMPGSPSRSIPADARRARRRSAAAARPARRPRISRWRSPWRRRRSVSEAHPGALVIGADQMLELDGERLTKPADMEAARRQLLRLSGTDASAALGGRLRARRARSSGSMSRPARLTMRQLDAGIRSAAISPRSAPDALTSVGAYQIEGRGIQLFERIDGDYFAILGLPLLPLLAFLRAEGVIE